MCGAICASSFSFTCHAKRRRDIQKMRVDFCRRQCIINAEIKQGSELVGKKNTEKI